MCAWLPTVLELIPGNHRLAPQWLKQDRTPARILLAVFLVIQFPAGAQEVFTAADASAIRAFLDQNFVQTNSAMVIGLLDKNGAQLFSAGKLDNGTDKKVDGDTIFEIGSTTKVFTSLLVFDMARRGDVQLDDPVKNYLPERVKVPVFEDKQITLRNLAAQDSGLPWNPDDLDKILLQEPPQIRLKKFKQACDIYSVEDLYASLARHTLTNPPGTRFQYSNLGMALLGHALELKTGQTYESLIVERICRPLKMTSTRINLTTELKSRLARGHWSDGTPSENINFQVLAPAGALLSTANDLLRFLSANLNFTETDFTQPLKEMQRRRHSSDPKFGHTATPWMDERVYHPPGSELLGHGGGGFGYLSFIGFDKAKRRGVVVLSNQMVWNPSGIGWAILQQMALTRENITYLVREIAGLGMALETDEKTGLLRITSVYPGSPAGSAGLSPGVLVHKINNSSVAGKKMNDCLGLLAGPIGTRVQIEVTNPNQKETKTIELTRQKFLTSSQ